MTATNAGARHVTQGDSWKRFALLVAALLMAMAAPASAEPIRVDGAFQSAMVGRAAELAYDPIGAASIEDVLAGKLAFAPSEKDAPSFGYRGGTEWLRFTVDDTRTNARPLVLENGYPATDVLELFEVEGDRVERSARVGRHVDAATWDVRTRLPAFELAHTKGRTFYLRLSSTSSHQLPLRLFEARAYDEHRSIDLALQCLYFGALLVMTLYNALVWLSTRGRAYAYYVAFLTFFCVFQLELSGLTRSAFGISSAHADFLIPISIAAYGAAGLAFADVLLDVRAWSHPFSRWLWGYGAVAFAAIFAACLGGYGLGMRTALVDGVGSAVLMVAVGIAAMKAGVRSAKLYLVAWGALLSGSLVNVLKSVGVLPTNGFTSNMQQLGSAIEFVLLSLALADRIKQLQAEATRNAQLAREAAEAAKRASEEKALAEAHAAEELRRLDKLKDEFLANTSHELRTPLNGVIGLADSMLAASDELPKATQQGLQTILASGRRLDRLVSDILDFSKAKSGELAVELGAVDLSSCVSEALLLLAPNVGKKSVRLANDVPPSFPLARADETRLAQVLQHVVGNAIKFTESGEVRVGAERRDGRLVLTVKDTGPGIAAERLATLFAAFEQGDGSATRAHGGTGLGLAFARQLMELQAGSIGVASEVGRGTTVSLVLVPAPPAAQAGRVQGKAANVRSIPPPAARQSVAPPARRVAEPMALVMPDAGTRVGLLSKLSTPGLRQMAEKPRASSAVRAPRLLVADDEPVNLERLQMDLENTGYELVCVEDGQAAVEAFDSQGPFDLVLLDVMMPRMDGLAACRAIRERAAAVDVPVLLITAKREPKDLQAGFTAGANDYLTKPYVRQELLERSRSHLATARSARAMQRFVPTKFAKLLGYQRLDEMKLGDCAEKELTVLFLDIHGFTSASERMTSRQVFGWLNDQFGVLVPAIRAHGGFVDKFVGDALMGLFAKGALAAVNAAADAMRKLRENEPTARVGIGIHHGPTMLGAIGDDARFSPTVVSDTVNVASRLENLTRRFDALVLLSDETVEAAGIARSGRTRYLGAFRVKGRSKALRIHELLDAEDPLVAGEKRSAAEFLVRMHGELERGEVEGAWAIAGEAREHFPIDPVVAFYRDALESMLQTGEGYEGALELREK
jgi:signal transduction histidine kinase/class 3 adenylate cyclase